MPMRDFLRVEAGANAKEIIKERNGSVLQTTTKYEASVVPHRGAFFRKKCGEALRGGLPFRDTPRVRTIFGDGRIQ